MQGICVYMPMDTLCVYVGACVYKYVFTFACVYAYVVVHALMFVAI